LVQNGKSFTHRHCRKNFSG